MPTTNPEKNREYVKKSQARRKAEVGVAQFNKEHTAAQMKHKEKVKSQDIEKFRKEQANYMKEYMKQYRAKKKASNSANVSTDAKANLIRALTAGIRMREAREELRDRAIRRANETADNLNKVYKEVMPKVRANKKKLYKIADRYGGIRKIQEENED